KTEEVSVFQKGAQTELLSRDVTQRLVALAIFLESVGDGVELLVFGAELRDGGIADVVHRLHEVADAVVVDGETELRLGGNFVALGHGDVAHVVAEAEEFAALP